MLQTKPWYDLRIPTINAIKQDWRRPSLNKNRMFGVWHYDPDKIMSREMYDTVEQTLGLKLARVMIFLKGSNYGSNKAHIDLMNTTVTNPRLQESVWALNFVIDPCISDMVWYQKPDGIMYVEFIDSHVPTPYAAWDISSLTEVARTEVSMTNMVLIRTDIPHAIDVRKGPRWTFSLRFEESSTMTWEQAVEYFKNLGLLIDE